MTQDEKELLFKDLCARLPYGVVCDMWDELESESKITERLKMGGLSAFYEHPGFGVRPYLRSMSSMTEEEKEYIKHRWCYEDWPNVFDFLNHYQIDAGDATHFTDWLNAHHFDYRIDPSTGKTLIESDLAIEAPKDMYKTE